MPPLPLRGPQGAPVLALVGWSGSGKTTLLAAVLPLLIDAGLRVSTLKHAHHKVDPDQQGKDSFRHRAAGAHETMLATSERFVLFHDHHAGTDEPDLPSLLARMAPADLFIAEGFKSASVAKIEVHRPALGKPALWPEFRDIVAVASDDPLEAGGLPVLPLNRPAAVAEFILRWHADAIA
ncbi:molybdopterin-guanine dinucleotide biosynthesis protein B [Acidiphilium sp. C61]|uniref:molybdopterin-guanine dinucleotide biosynthesis protein B n=1 Tax=Acidiphilium sp. C61 TaxID=1671485 RepID=UPI00157AC7CF|nr:molybdopterin-guanine dinucleotide biosynthesis protein B [Acidiphilium sp. C61]